MSLRPVTSLDVRRLMPLIRLAEELAPLAEGETEEGRHALAHALVHRLKGRADLPARNDLLALAAICRAAADAGPGPAGPATRFHPHTECPDWARRETPLALIGGHFFYAAPREEGHQT
ncbi:hypothetical protein [Parvibaculum sp.]|jgi:hypothetical protein|uniref:hypothetical protein n=1 Tax=Parvibaculum sp. TaxID=2024848 RepID=UPI002A309752|nr:hypothetical protein [Parvibaculum sp.]